MAQTNQLEESLKEIFVDKAPKLPENAKKILVQYAPWLSLIGGILTAWAAWSIWHWAHLANTYVNYANQINEAFGSNTIIDNRLGVGIWLSMLVLIVQAALLLLAFPGLRDHKKSGWNLVYYSVLVNLAYGIIVMFTSYGGFGSLVGAVIGAAISFYFLFQIRSRYIHQVTADNTRPSAPSTT